MSYQIDKAALQALQTLLDNCSSELEIKNKIKEQLAELPQNEITDDTGGDKSKTAEDKLIDWYDTLNTLVDQAKEKQYTAVWEAAEKVKLSILQAILMQAAQALQLDNPNKPEASKSKQQLVFILGAFAISAYGGTKGYLALSSVLSAVASKASIGVILGSCAVASAFLMMYWAFEIKEFQKQLGISFTSSKNIRKTWHAQVALFDSMTNLLKTDVKESCNMQNSKAQSKNEVQKERMNRLQTHKKFKKVLHKIYEIDIKSKRDTAIEIQKKYEQSNSRKLKEAAMTGVLGTLNGLFVGYLGVSLVTVITGMKAATLLSLAGGPIAFAATIATFSLFFAAGFLVSAYIKKHGKSIARNIGMNGDLDKIAQSNSAQALQEYKDSIELQEKRAADAFTTENNTTKNDLKPVYTEPRKKQHPHFIKKNKSLFFRENKKMHLQPKRQAIKSNQLIVSIHQRKAIGRRLI